MLSKGISLKDVTIYGQRPLKEIGVQKTAFDSTELKENISLSMGDVLTYNSSLYVKNYGRATLSTVSFRGTSPSHTQVTWNGMKLNNPMLGSTDFSMIPSYFIDDASLLHGTSSVNQTGGGLGGLVSMTTKPANAHGFGLQYIQGIGSFNSFDEFLRLTYGDKHWQVSTRAVLSTSPNNFEYRNHDKKENIYDDDMNIIGQYYPVEENKSGAYKDFHFLQEAYYNTGTGHKFGLNAWYLQSKRKLPMLTTDYAEDTSFENVQRELNKIRLKQIKTDGVSAEELQETNEQLVKKIEQLEDKLCRYSDYELTEMKRALDAEKDYLTRIQNQNVEIAESKAELTRLKNGQMEYEQLRSQLDLLRTLNEHLRSELDNTKKMLESSVGEICPALTAVDIQQTEEVGDEYNRVLERTQNIVTATNSTMVVPGTFTRPGWKITSWHTRPDGDDSKGTRHTPKDPNNPMTGVTLNLSESVTLYAQWTETTGSGQ